jgi:uncharacterized lipoprotein YddW (UPF0748 family)
MKKCVLMTIFFAFITTFSFALFLPALQADMTPAPLREFRAIWVITWEMFRDKSGHPVEGEALKKRIDEILQNIKQANLNTVLWQVRQGGTVYYPSQFENWGRYTNYKSPGFDPLAYALDKAKSLGLEFHAWINSFEARDNHALALAARRPEWLATDAEGKVMTKAMALSPGHPEARRHLAELVQELASRYDVDGIHLDYIRWSEFPMGEVDGPQNSRPLFQFDQLHPANDGVPEGYSDWNSWRRAQVSRAVAQIREQLNKIPRKILLSVAAIGKFDWGFWNGYHIVHQDSAGWLNAGVIDHLMAMNYTAKTSEKLQGDLIGNCPEACWESKIEEGLLRGGRFSVGIGSLMLRNADLWNNHLDLVEITRSIPWISGLQFFSYGDWEIKDYFSPARRQFLYDQER